MPVHFGSTLKQCKMLPGYDIPVSSTKSLQELACAAWQEPELLEEVLKVQGGHEGLGAMRFRDALSCAAAVRNPSPTKAASLPLQDLAHLDTLRALERTAELWGQVCE